MATDLIDINLEFLQTNCHIEKSKTAFVSPVRFTSDGERLVVYIKDNSIEKVFKIKNLNYEDADTSSFNNVLSPLLLHDNVSYIFEIVLIKRQILVVDMLYADDLKTETLRQRLSQIPEFTNKYVSVLTRNYEHTDEPKYIERDLIAQLSYRKEKHGTLTETNLQSFALVGEYIERRMNKRVYTKPLSDLPLELLQKYNINDDDPNAALNEINELIKRKKRLTVEYETAKKMHYVAGKNLNNKLEIFSTTNYSNDKTLLKILENVELVRDQPETLDSGIKKLAPDTLFYKTFIVCGFEVKERKSAALVKKSIIGNYTYDKLDQVEISALIEQKTNTNPLGKLSDNQIVSEIMRRVNPDSQKRAAVCCDELLEYCRKKNKKE